MLINKACVFDRNQQKCAVMIIRPVRLCLHLHHIASIAVLDPLHDRFQQCPMDPTDLHWGYRHGVCHSDRKHSTAYSYIMTVNSNGCVLQVENRDFKKLKALFVALKRFEKKQLMMMGF